MKAVLISRAPEFSPNNEANDAAILHAVADRLRMQTHEVTLISELQLSSTSAAEVSAVPAVPAEVESLFAGADIVLSMARRMSSLLWLSRWQQRTGVEVLNAPQSVLCTVSSRETTLDLLSSHGVPVPPYWGYEASDDPMFLCDASLQALLPGWVKGMHPRGVTPSDVRYVSTPLEADTCLLELTSQRYADIIVMRHQEGAVLKCYCVCDSGFQPRLVRSFWPQQEGYTKFGDECHNQPIEFPEAPSDERLTQLSALIARSLGLRIFGFDLIVSPQGSLFVIDVNDWPSFSRFRTEAAAAIAQS